MALDLHFAAEAEQLKDVLLKELRHVWAENPLACPTIIVPNPAVKRWLTLQMAREFGAVLGAEITTLERAIWNWLDPEPNMRRLDATAYQQILVKLLRPEFISADFYEPVRNYIGEKDALRRWQLAGFLSNLFLEYEYNRPSVWRDGAGWVLPGIDASWLSQKSYTFSREVSELVRKQEQWQMDLYRRSIAEVASLGKGERLLSLPHLHRMRCEQGFQVQAGHVHLFLVSKISHWHRNLLVDISQMQGSDIHVFLTNPCAEFWEDVDTRSSKTWRRKWNVHDKPAKQGIQARTPEEYRLEEFGNRTFATDPRLLELWGHSARENIALWCPLAEWNFEYHAPTWLDEESSQRSCLRALQGSLLRREANLPAETKSDQSLQILNAPDLGREVEELREQILDAVEQHKVDRLEDIVVYVTDLPAYLPQIERVFGAYRRWDAGYVAYQVFGAPGGGSVYAQAVQALLEILNGRYDRAALFTLFRNPVWQASHSVQASELAVWEEWAANTGMFRGYDEEHRKLMGDVGAAASNAHTFSLGIYRLLLGSLANGPVELGFGYPISGYRDYGTGDVESLEHFLDALEAMKEISQSQIQEDLGEALATVIQHVERILPNLPLDAEWNPLGEQRVQKSFLDDLRSAKEMAVRSSFGKCSREELMSVVQGCLPQELNPGSKAWMGGVTFAALRMGMVLPHKMICVLGLGAKEFPGTRNTSVLDLLSTVRIVGDSHPIRDNQLAFLEVVHAAKERLVLSFRGKNLQKQEDLQPSSVLMELMDYLRSQGGIDPVRKVALGIWDEPRIWNKRASQIRKAGETKRALHRFGNQWESAAYKKENAHGQVTLRHVIDFLSNPLAYHVSRTLELDQEEDAGALEIKDEPLDISILQWSSLQKELWEVILKEVFPNSDKNCPEEEMLRNELRREAERLCGEAEIGGNLPLAPFSKLVRDELHAWIPEATKTALKLRTLYSNHYYVGQTDLSLGREGARATLSIGEYTIAVPVVMALVPRDAVSPVVVLKLEKTKKIAENLPLLCTGYCMAMVHSSVHLVKLPREGGDLEQLAMQFMTDAMRDRMQRYLITIINDMLSGSAEHLPFDTVVKAFGAIKKKEEAPDIGMIFVESLEEIDSGRYPAYKNFNPAWKLVEARFPEQNKVQELIDRRFRPILEGWFHG